MSHKNRFIEQLKSGIGSTVILYGISLALALFFLYVPEFILTLAGHSFPPSDDIAAVDGDLVALTALLLIPSIVIMLLMVDSLVKDPDWFDGTTYWCTLVAATWVALMYATLFEAPEGSSLIAIAFWSTAWLLGSCVSAVTRDRREERSNRSTYPTTVNNAS